MMLRSVLPACLVLGCVQLAHAQAIDDPTRPPAALWTPAASEAPPPKPARPQLQSVLISNKPGGRRVAVIDGQIVRQGGKVGDAVVVEIQDTAVVLRRGKSLETFKLYPAPKIENKPGASAGRKQE
ncbi:MULTISPECIES: MSHA biogenesis protein MshK [unclassified Janthinobacterium]|uniref:MSHA biogenesis protein MshK n=1 Tax=unclassified Janthinobacterium TaxID=2610881 RepID=UPI00162051C6|nr:MULTISPECIES: MSHA biogenesis protein MshK [unclassified Janthinobacterium]MBB5609540.1 MSHA biogenesis protein MshK [Janthinobacterium sp. S3T4]MBB5614613.1 MSHA biogenesis protein MshK [Janthinobacterium sp. S3M3]